MVEEREVDGVGRSMRARVVHGVEPLAVGIDAQRTAA